MKQQPVTLKSFFAQFPTALWVVVLLYIIVMVVLSIWQYRVFNYNGLDLAIFDQVLWNTVRGDLFAYSFNNYSYLVDHREWLLLLIAPIYAIAQHPITLLLLQSLWLGLGALPLYLLAVKIIGPHYRKLQYVGVIAAVLYLMQPTIQSMNLFEFHMLPLAIPLSLWMWWAVTEQRWRIVVFCVILMFLLREELGLLLFGVGLLLIVDHWLTVRRNKEKRYNTKLFRWSIVLMVMSIIMFLAMTAIGSWLSPDDTPKFIIFYTWLGSTPFEALQTILHNPIRGLSVLLDYDHSILILFLFLNVALLPFFRLRYLLPAVVPLLLYLFVDQQMLSSVLKSHHGSMILPWFFIAGIYGYSALQQKFERMNPRSMFKMLELHRLVPLFVCFIVVAQWLNLGPHWVLAHEARLLSERNLKEYDAVVQQIQPNDVVVASDRLYSKLARRSELYTTLHIFTGKVHFSKQEYELPTDVDWLLLEQDMILREGIYLPFIDREFAWQRFQYIIDQSGLELYSISEDLIVFSRYENSAQSDGQRIVGKEGLITLTSESLPHVVGQTINTDLYLHGWEYRAINATQGELQLLLSKTTQQSIIEDDEHIMMTWYDNDGAVVKEKLFPLGYGIDPSHQWDRDENSRRLITFPLTHPVEAQSLSVSFAPLKSIFGPFFTLWTADPALDDEQMTTISLDEIQL